MRKSGAVARTIRELSITDDRIVLPENGRPRGSAKYRNGNFVKRHKKIISTVASLGVLAAGAKYVLPVVQEICSSRPICSTQAAIANKPKPIDSSALIASTVKGRPPVTGIAQFTIVNIKRHDETTEGQKLTTIEIGAKAEFDPVKYQEASGTKLTKAVNLTSYLVALCGTKVPAARAAGLTELNNIIESSKSHADALVSSTAIVTPQMLKSAENGYTVTARNPALPMAVVYDTETNKVVHCNEPLMAPPTK